MLFQEALDDEEFGLDSNVSGSSVTEEEAPAVVMEAVQPVLVVPVQQEQVVTPVIVEAVAAPVPAPVVQAAPSVAVVSNKIQPAVVAEGSQDEELSKKLQRAARFGIEPVPTVVAKVETDKKAQRAARFGIEEKVQAPVVAQQQKGNKKGGNKPVPVAAEIDPALAEKIRLRVERFGVVSQVAKTAASAEVTTEEVV